MNQKFNTIFKEPRQFSISKSNGLTQYYWDNRLEIKLNNNLKTYRLHLRSNIPVIKEQLLLKDFKIEFSIQDLDKENFYFGFKEGERMTLEEFESLLNKIQLITDTSVENIKSDIATLLDVSTEEVHNNYEKIILIGINTKSKEYELYISPKYL